MRGGERIVIPMMLADMAGELFLVADSIRDAARSNGLSETRLVGHAQ